MHFHTLNDYPEKEQFPGFMGRFVHTENMTIAFWNILAGHAIPVHHHIHEQVMHLLDGKFELTVDGITRVLEKDALVTIPSQVPHGGHAITDCRVMDVFSPVREDYQ